MRTPALALAALTLAATPGLAQSPAPQSPRIVVTGEGMGTAVPDLALLSLTVMREAATAGEAMDQGSQAMRDVIAAMKEAGIADRDLQTSSFQIMPRYTYDNRPDGSQEARLVGYQVSNTLSVRVRDISRTGAILDTAVKLGVNQGGTISFQNEDPGAAMDEARKKAVEDARHRAEILAGAGGVTLGRVIEISDQLGAPQPMPQLARAFDKAESAVPIQAGENAYNVQVTVTFELLP
jgi:uncharacterized protein YggE